MYLRISLAYCLPCVHILCIGANGPTQIYWLHPKLWLFCRILWVTLWWAESFHHKLGCVFCFWQKYLLQSWMKALFKDQAALLPWLFMFLSCVHHIWCFPLFWCWISDVGSRCFEDFVANYLFKCLVGRLGAKIGSFDLSHTIKSSGITLEDHVIQYP